jgi:predicted ATP-grasp superfamily ATP-dependent carboligase
LPVARICSLDSGYAQWIFPMSTVKKPRVLVLDADMIPCLAVARSLWKKGCQVDVAGHTQAPITRYSRAVDRCFTYPNPLSDTDKYLDWFEQQTKSTQYDLAIPVTERTMSALSSQRDRFSHVKIAMPEVESLEQVIDKSKTMSLARQVGVPVPRGVELQSMEGLDELIDDLNFPVVLKPTRSIGAGGAGGSQLYVSYAFDRSELQAGCAHALRFGSVLLQEYFHGAGVGIELIAKDGEIAYVFQHRRLHEVPLTGGGSSLRRSEPVNPELLEASRRLVEVLHWNGVAMIEFKLDDVTGEFRLMEVNGRFWGSLPLALASGADFPGMLLDMELTGAVTSSPPYRESMYCRLLSRDLQWYEAVLRADALSPIVRVPPRLEIIKELALCFSWKHRFDVQSWRDPVPGLVDVGRVLLNYRRRLASLRSDRRFRAAQVKVWRSGAVEARLSQAHSMLFLCYGNINRSALADLMLRPYAEDSGYTLESAGFHHESDRQTDPVMADLANERGLQAGAFRSSTVTPEMLARSDIIFVMEKRHYDQVMAMDSSAGERTFLLGAHSSVDDWGPEIDDPHGCSFDIYRECYARLDAAVAAIKAMIAAQDQG